MTPLSPRLKKAVEDALHDNALLAAVPALEREQAALWYEAVAEQTVGNHAALARLYNLERAKFLRGQVARIARSAPDYAREIGGAAGGEK